MTNDCKAISGIIFDFDGVIIDSEPYWRMAEFDVFNNEGFNISHEDAMQNTGKRVEELVAEYQQKYNFSDTLAIKLTANIYAQALEAINDCAKPMNGIYDAINLFIAHNKTLAIASSSPISIITSVLENLQIRDVFTIVHSAEQELYGKPHPAVYISTSNMLNLGAHQCLVIEDSLNGLISAKAAKMRCILLDEKKDKYFAKIADKAIKDFTEIDSKLIQELGG